MIYVLFIGGRWLKNWIKLEDKKVSEFFIKNVELR